MLFFRIGFNTGFVRSDSLINRWLFIFSKFIGCFVVTFDEESKLVVIVVGGGNGGVFTLSWRNTCITVFFGGLDALLSFKLVLFDVDGVGVFFFCKKKINQWDI